MPEESTPKINNLGKKVTGFFTDFWRGMKMISAKISLWCQIFHKSKFFFYAAKVVVVLVVFLAIAQFCFSIAIYGFKVDNNATKRAAKILPFPVAVINYDFITLSEFQNEKDYIHHFYSATQQEGVNYSDIDSQILDQLIENRVIRFEALKYKTTVSSKEIDDTINNIAVQNGGQDKVEKVLNDLYGLSLKDFRKLVEVQMLRDKIDEKVITHITARHILIQVASTAAPDQVTAAKTKLDGVLTQIKGGMSFSDAAKKYSEDSGSASNGGLLQSFTMGDMVKPFSDAAFTAKVGDIVGPVRTEYGWHLIQVESRTGSVNKSFTDWLAGIKSKSLVLKLYMIK